MSNTGRFRDTAPSMAAAGKVTALATEATEVCVKPDIYGRAPPTPEHVKKYRKSFYSEPGMKIRHRGLVNDPAPDTNAVYGRKTGVGEHVSDVFAVQRASQLQEYLRQRKESIYQSTKREPLGKAFTRNYSLPEEVKSEDFKYGVKSNQCEAAKELLFPANGVLEESPEATRLYLKSHSDFAPGQQRRRDYSWPVDPDQFRFGIMHKNKELDGVGVALKPEGYKTEFPKTKIVSKALEDYRAVSADELGRRRNLGYDLPPPEHSYGKTIASGNWSVKDCLQGMYTPEDLQPDKDLGRSKARFFQEPSRPGGVPSIRTDIPKREKSVANYINFGDEPQAGDLLVPDKFLFSGIEQSDFEALRSAEEVREIFATVGYTYADDEFELLSDYAMHQSQGRGISLKSFIGAVNDKIAYDTARQFGSLTMQQRFTQSR
eukprot:GILI01006748.1.p1 GENE.GILI01006748.1~~GILI01006748.1.p1  ORF type:complete len:449 (+),score=65.06 GILI01006748.1:52-1347(+)